MSKKVSFHEKATAKIMTGMEIASNAVIGTIGPKGKNVYFEDKYTPTITNDGATIASKIILKDKEEDVGAYLIRNVSAQQNDDVGDGTTTVVALTQAIIKEAIKRPENPNVVKESLNQAKQGIIDKLEQRKVTIPIEEIEKVTLISTENAKLATLIAEIVQKLGTNAHVAVEDATGFETTSEIVEGYETKHGFMSPHFADKKTGQAILEDVAVLVSEKKISNLIDIKPLLDKLGEAQMGSCVIVCDDIEESILGVLVANKAMGRFQSIVIRASGDDLKDIAGSVGATIVSPETGVTLAKIELSHLGHAKKVVCDAHKTLFIGEPGVAKEYADELERSEPYEENMFRKERLRLRVAELRGGVGIIKVGASSDFEREYLKLKAQDGIKATLAALEEGVVEGGGMTLWRIAQEMTGETCGEEVLKRALTAPLKAIIANTGEDYGEIIRNMPADQGYNAKTNKIENLIEAGVIDPKKVERCAVENAISAASTFITIFATITEEDEIPRNNNT